MHFDEIAKDKIFQSIDKIKEMKVIIKESYETFKNKLGRVPYLLDFYENSEIDPVVIVREYKTYQTFFESVEKQRSIETNSLEEIRILEYLSKTVISGIGPYELEILDCLMKQDIVSVEQMKEKFQMKYGHTFDNKAFSGAISVLQGHFVEKEEEYQKYSQIDIINMRAARKKDNNRKDRDITKFETKMHHPVREDLLKYFQSSNITTLN